MISTLPLYKTQYSCDLHNFYVLDYNIESTCEDERKMVCNLDLLF